MEEERSEQLPFCMEEERRERLADAKRIAEIVARVTYKDGCKLSLHISDIKLGSDVNMQLEFVAVVPCRPSCAPAEVSGQDRPRTEICCHRILRWDRRMSQSLEEYVMREIRELIRTFEQHEADEWLMFDGRRVFDPHSSSG
jgi:hypothetical protein